jgi:hypothetical protein
MSIWNKVLLGLIAVASLGFLYLAARSLQTHASWMSTAQKLEKSIERVAEENRVLLEGDNGQPGINQLLVEKHNWLIDRPRVWPNCTVQVKTDKPKATATIAAAMDLPTPHGIAANSTLYAFEMGAADKPPRYLGEFNVTKAEEKSISLSPAYPLSQADLKRLDEAARAPWSFYDYLPQDNHETFAVATDEQKNALLPKDTVAEYLKDGKPATEQDPKERINAGRQYVRFLRDYPQIFNFFRKQATVLNDEIEATTRDKALVDESLADAQRQVQFAQNQITDVKARLDKKTKEDQAVVKLRDQLQEKLASIIEAVKSLIEKNKAMAGQIAEKQLEATRRIDARTRAMAQNAGEK